MATVSSMPTQITVREVQDTQQLKTFINFPWKLYKDDPHWVPPLLSIRRDLLVREKNPSWEYLQGTYYLAYRGDEVVGTIAAFVNPRHNEFNQEHIAMFGFFETVNDESVARALLAKAEDYARAGGYDALRGPMSFTDNDEVGILVEGFERPILQMAYNPPYYRDLLESAGFSKAMDLLSFHADWDILNNSGVLERFNRLTEKAMQRGNITIRPVDRKRLKEEFQLLKDIYNQAWGKNWGFTPMTPGELDALVDGFGMMFDARLAAFAYVGDDPAGFLLAAADFNEVLAKARPNPNIPEPITLIRALWHWKIRPTITWMRIPWMGIKAEHRGKGIDMALFNYIVQQIDALGYQHGDCSWVLETNQPLVSLANKLKFETHRVHRLYEKRLDAR